MNRSLRWLWLDDLREHARAGAISPCAHHVGMTIGVYYTNGTGVAWPSQQELVDVTGWSIRAVRRGLDELEAHGLLSKRHGPPARGHGHVYQLERRPRT